MQILFYLVFLFVGYMLTMFIFNFSTYHRYFFWAGPVLGVFAVAQAYVLCLMNLAAFFLWHLLIMVGVFIWWFAKTVRSADGVGKAADAGLLEDQQKGLYSRSLNRTFLYLFLSILIYISSFSIGFIYIFNNYFI